MICAEVDELGAAFAIGAVHPDERRSIVAHLESCQEPHAELRQAIGAEAMLAATVEPVTPDPALRDRVMATVAATRQEHVPAAAPAKRAPFAGWLSPGWARGLAAAGVATALVLAVLSAALYVRLADRDEALRSVAAAIGAGDNAFRVEGDAGRGYVVETAGSGATLVLADLAGLPSDRLYALWLIPDGGAPVAVGTFRPSGETVAVVEVERDLAGFTTFAVTVERERVDAPTGDPVLVAALNG